MTHEWAISALYRGPETEVFSVASRIRRAGHALHR